MSKAKILIADDEHETVESIASFLTRRFKCTVYKAFNGRDAVEILRKKHLDLVILDLHMPILSGDVVMLVTRGEKELPPIIIVSAYSDSNTIDELLEEGATYFLPKPYDLIKLHGLVKTILEKKG
jgi:DNA-binding response OmpR family regulator